MTPDDVRSSVDPGEESAGTPMVAAAASTASATAPLRALVRQPRILLSPVARAGLSGIAALGVAIAANKLMGKPVLFLRWSFVRFMLSLKHMGATWQVGDGREAALADYVCSHARADDIDDAIATIDEYCYHKRYLINIGDEKGKLLDDAVRAAHPSRLLELGTYCGYSALRIVRAMPADALLHTIEFNASNAEVAQRIWDHAGVGDRISVIVGTLGDNAKTLGTLRNRHNFSSGTLDFVFLDHEKSEYLPDLHRILDQGWLHPGSVVVADNMKYPGAPDYRDYMTRREGIDWHTRAHRTHAEYQKIIPDLVFESTYRGWHSAQPDRP